MNALSPDAALGLDLARAHLRAERRRGTVLLLGAGLALAVTFVASVGLGAMGISPGAVLAILADAVGVGLPWTFTPSEAAVVLELRLPRALLGILVGAGLGLAGAALQGVFRNPLADPGLIGISSGARLFASLHIVLGATPILAWASALGPFTLPIFAFGGAWLAAWTVYALGRQDGRTDVPRMLLAGVAIGMLVEALAGLLVFAADDAALRALTMWRLGSLAGADWTTVPVVAAITGVAALGLARLARPLDVMLLGEADAEHLGVDVERVKRRAVLFATLAVGAGVAFVGIVGFVGLVVPHLARLAAGPEHRVVLPASAALGALLVLAADLTCRTLAAPAELPLGIITALVGAPFFLWLLTRRSAA